MTYDHIRVTPLATSVGAEISGIDLARPVDEPELAEIRRAFGEYGVVFFRDQQLSLEQHIAFARCFGGIDVNRFFATVPGYPMIAEVRKEPEQQRNIGNGWHTDHSYDEAPALGSMLYAREVPKTGGDTLFASMYAAYDALSDGLKSTLEGAKGIAFEPPRLRRRGDGKAGRPRGPHSQCRARDPGRRAPGRHPPPRHRPQGSRRGPRCAARRDRWSAWRIRSRRDSPLAGRSKRDSPACSLLRDRAAVPRVPRSHDRASALLALTPKWNFFQV